MAIRKLDHQKKKIIQSPLVYFLTVRAYTYMYILKYLYMCKIYMCICVYLYICIFVFTCICVKYFNFNSIVKYIVRYIQQAMELPSLYRPTFSRPTNDNHPFRIRLERTQKNHEKIIQEAFQRKVSCKHPGCVCNFAKSTLPRDTDFSRAYKSTWPNCGTRLRDLLIIHQQLSSLEGARASLSSLFPSKRIQ